MIYEFMSLVGIVAKKSKNSRKKSFRLIRLNEGA